MFDEVLDDNRDGLPQTCQKSWPESRVSEVSCCDVGKKNAMNHPPNHYVMYCIGGRNHSQKCGLLMFHPHCTFKVFAEDVLALPGRSQCVEMAKEGASVPFVW